MIEIYTDGSYSKKGGGYGIVVIKNNSLLLTIEGHEQETTNNRMELTALLVALYLAAHTYANDSCMIKSDSNYCVSTFNIWIKTWAQNNWINSQKKQVENLDLIKQIYKYTQIDFPNFCITRVKGHCGNLGNELADAAATSNLNKFTNILQTNSENLVYNKNFDFYKKI